MVCTCAYIGYVLYKDVCVFAHVRLTYICYYVVVYQRLTADFAIIVNLVAPVAYCRLCDWLPSAAISGLTVVQAAQVRNHVHSQGCIATLLSLYFLTCFTYWISIYIIRFTLYLYT